MIKNKKVTTIMTTLRQMLDAYQARGLKIWHILGEGIFEHLRKHIEHMDFNITRWDEYVPEIESYIRTINERVKVTENTLPFEQYPNTLIVETVYNAVFWLYCFPDKNGIHLTLSHESLIQQLTKTNIVHYSSEHT